MRGCSLSATSSSTGARPGRRPREVPSARRRTSTLAGASCWVRFGILRKTDIYGVKKPGERRTAARPRSSWGDRRGDRGPRPPWRRSGDRAKASATVRPAAVIPIAAARPAPIARASIYLGKCTLWNSAELWVQTLVMNRSSVRFRQAAPRNQHVRSPRHAPDRYVTRQGVPACHIRATSGGLASLFSLIAKRCSASSLTVSAMARFR